MRVFKLNNINKFKYIIAIEFTEVLYTWNMEYDMMISRYFKIYIKNISFSRQYQATTRQNLDVRCVMPIWCRPAGHGTGVTAWRGRGGGHSDIVHQPVLVSGH